MKYSDLNININKDTIYIEPFNINVLQYLPIEDKNDLIFVTLQRADENGFYNPVKLQMFSELYTVYMYSDLEFTDEEKLDETLLYNVLKSNGIIDVIMNALPEKELYELQQMMDDSLRKKEKYRNSITGVLNSFIENLAPNAENAAQIINNFNPEMFQQVIKFAEAANGNRPIQ